ncbi:MULTISPECIES: hypothetical protein [Diaphorobacter]|uniref:hypothetical protein n=1 Tax=Diaphorobacter TaxID=238749 RepID=UPI0002DE5F0E|nr:MULTISPECIES: hypothetical protein [Diaphorobacter]POR12155.1 hypothetical protein BV908_04600 [Diaphorobacter sp. LR2014-1]PZU39702.1 MAG: hypothetical protein DI574_06850 [Acidovorax sp.]QPN30506.1 hypothetical protein I3K84_17190 [Diaphorobacter sp. JS3051]
MPTSNQQPGKPDTMTRVLYMLETIGRAHLRGGLHISETLPLVQQSEVGAILDHLAEFAAKIDIVRQERHERPE